MPKFCVPIEREVIQYNYVIIEAESAADARDKYRLNDYEYPEDFDDHWEECKHPGDHRIAEGRNQYVLLAKSCQDDGYHDHFYDDLSEDYLCSYSLGEGGARHHFKCHADDEDDAEEKLLAVVPNAKDIYVELFEPEFEKLPGLHQAG